MASNRNTGRGNTAGENPLGPTIITGDDNQIEVNGILFTEGTAGSPDAAGVEAAEEPETAEARTELAEFVDATGS